MHVQQHMARQNGEGGVKKTRTNVTPNLSCHVFHVQVLKTVSYRHTLAQETSAPVLASASDTPVVRSSCRCISCIRCFRVVFGFGSVVVGAPSPNAHPTSTQRGPSPQGSLVVCPHVPGFFIHSEQLPLRRLWWLFGVDIPEPLSLSLYIYVCVYTYIYMYIYT